jgi:hypothetical protein
MDEGNSCFGGGKEGVSDAYASALWVADYMLHVACAGFAGVNLHGGGTGFYTPIESSDKKPVAPRPMYYGMQFAQQFSGFAVTPCALNGDANVTAYWGSRGPEVQLAVVNKSAQPVDLELPSRLQTEKLTQKRLLQGPALNAKEGVRFGEKKLTGKTPVNRLPGHSAIILNG